MTTPLRQKMMEDLQLHGLSGKTQDLYVLAVQQLAEHYHKSPDQITEAELRAYFLYLLNEKRVAPSTLPVALSGVKFFYVYTCSGSGRPFNWCVRRARKSCRSSSPSMRCA